MQALTTKQQQLIVSNVIKACGDIEKLNSTGYKFLYLCSGFIAHYNIDGFKAYYSEHSLIDDIERNASFNQWKNFSPSDKDYEYYMSKRAVYNAILGFFAACEYQSIYGD
jgi:hypothetical protein